jgi:hypothetical protein
VFLLLLLLWLEAVLTADLKESQPG